MDPIKRLYENRNKIRRQNLSEDVKIWRFILDNIEDDKVFTEARKHETLYFKLKNQNLKNKNKEFIKSTEKVLTSVASQIFKNNAIEFNIENIEDIKLDLIKKKISSILNSPSSIQSHFCKNPNKQTCDETLQTLMLNEKINVLGLHACKAKPNMYIFNGGFLPKKNEGSKGAKSIDVFVAEKNLFPDVYFANTKKFSDKLILLGYQKTIMVSGGHQNNQLKDILLFINKADEYIKNNNDKVFFFIQADGDYCVDNIEKITKEIKNKNRIFAGTTIEINKGIKNVSK